MIRLVTPNDAREIAEFVVDIRQETVPMIHDAGGVEWFIRNRLIPRGSSFVYLENDEIVAWLDVYDGWLDQLYCKRGHTGRSIGKELVDFAKSKAPEGLQLWTFQVNQGARRFYNREGFEEVELTDGANCEEKQPDVRLIWKPEA